MKKQQTFKYKRNVWFLTLHLMFSKRITGPVMMLLYQAFGLNYTQIGTLSAITTLSDGSLEIFGGAFSDVYGRRKCSLAYAILAMINMAIFAFGHSFLHFAIGNAIYGASIALGSGNASALLFDTLKAIKMEKKYKRYRGIMMLAAKILNGIFILALPFLYLHNIKLPFQIGFGLYAISFITALFLKEPSKLETFKTPGVIKTAQSAFKEIAANKKVMFLIAFQAVWTGFVLLFFEYFQPIIKIAGIPLVYFGLVYAFARLFEGLGSVLIHKFEHHTNRQLLYSNILILILVLFGFGLTRSYWLMAFILLGCIVDGTSDVLLSETFNHNISTSNRTTILSTANVFNCLFTSSVLFIFGHTTDRYGIQGMFRAAGISFVLLLALLYFLLRGESRHE